MIIPIKLLCVRLLLWCNTKIIQTDHFRIFGNEILYNGKEESILVKNFHKNFENISHKSHMDNYNYKKVDFHKHITMLDVLWT